MARALLIEVSIGGNLQFVKSDAVAIGRDTIAREALFIENTTIDVVRNTIGGNLICQGNTRPEGGSNTVGGEKNRAVRELLALPSARSKHTRGDANFASPSCSKSHANG